MRVCLIGRGTPETFLSGERTGEADVWAFAFQNAEAVSYEKELKGETGRFETLAMLSKKKRAVVVCGFLTDSLGLKRKSVLVAENGKILGVSDMINVFDGELNAGACARIFETKRGRIGIVVAEDLYFFEVVKSLSTCGVDYIVCPFGVACGEIEKVMLRANAFCFGVPILFCSKNYSLVVNASGEVEFASPAGEAFLSFEPIKEYHLVETRRRGFFRSKKGES